MKQYYHQLIPWFSCLFYVYMFLFSFFVFFRYVYLCAIASPSLFCAHVSCKSVTLKQFGYGAFQYTEAECNLIVISFSKLSSFVCWNNRSKFFGAYII